MRSVIGAVLAAVAASACCLGPVVFAAVGSGALAAASTRLASVRPLFLALTLMLLGFGLYRTYRTPATTACRDASCMPEVNRKSRVILWIATIAVVLVAAFPYYAEYLF